MIADPAAPLLPGAGTYTYEIYACRGPLPDPNQPGWGMPGMGGFSEYSYRGDCRLSLVEASGNPDGGHTVWMEEDENGDLTVKASWYLADSGHKDASFFQIDLLRPDLSLANAASDSGYLRVDVAQRERVIGQVTQADRQQYPGVWRAIFRAVDDHGPDGTDCYRRNSENKRLFARNTRFRVGR